MANTEKATFGAGCFWGVEDAFRSIPGVIDAVSGYSGGDTSQPTYKQVCTGKTNHAEVVEVTFDPEQVSYETLLQKFWRSHDASQKNRQGPDIGTQYRSAIFTHSDDQKKIAEASRDAWQKHLTKPIATEITPAPPFWRAEEYHQRYHEKNGGSCHI